MKFNIPRTVSRTRQYISILAMIVLFAAPLCAQRPATPARPPSQPETRLGDPAFDTLLSADSYKLYGEVRNVGQLLSTGGAGEIIEPIIKLADPPKEFKSIIKFLKANAEALASSRLLFATWPARTGIPDALVAIEFPSADDAAKFAPKLEMFLPGILPPVPVATPEEKTAQTRPAEPGRPQAPEVKPEAPPPAASPQPPDERPAFVLSHSGNLVFISDKNFKLEKLRSPSGKLLAEDQNFRVAHDRFSTEPVFLYFNVALEERNKPKFQDAEIAAQAAAERLRMEEEARAEAEGEMNRNQAAEPEATPLTAVVENTNVLTGRTTVTINDPQASPTPTPTKEQQAQAIATSQIGNLLDPLGFGQPQWPEAIGVALALDNNDYVIRAILIEPPGAKKLPLPFVPQLLAGPAAVAEAPSVLPDSTEVFVSVSIDFSKTFEGMRKESQIKTKLTGQIPVGDRELPADAFVEFEKKAGFKITEELLPALGNEIAFAGSLSSLQGLGLFNAAPPKASASPDASDRKDQDKKESEPFPMLLIAVRDREAARRLMPHVLDGLGIGEANLIAQAQKREDVEIVNYGGFFAYAFIGNFLVISDLVTVNKTIDAYLNRQTLSSNNAFRNSRRWEPRQNLGEIYVSPALMEGYHEEVRKQAATLDPAMRDFILALDPTSSAITYAMSNEGLGTQHEIHLPKNLIITMVAGVSSAMKNPPPETNEMVAINSLLMIANAESSYQTTAGKGKYGTLDNLVAEKLVSREFFEKYGYNLEVTASGDHFEAVATPREYGKTGKRSFFIDQTAVVRGDDHGGGPATISDKPVQ